MKNIVKTCTNLNRSVYRQVRATRSCNLCSSCFHPRTAFDRYCQECREHNELLRFSDWLPDLNPVIEEKLIA